MEGILAVVFIFGGGTAITITAIAMAHVRKMAEIRARGGESVNTALRTELELMKREISGLRETSTKFDMSLDAAIERVEGRVDRLEERSVSRYTTTGDAAETLKNGH